MRLDGVFERGNVGARIVEVDAPPKLLAKIQRAFEQQHGSVEAGARGVELG